MHATRELRFEASIPASYDLGSWTGEGTVENVGAHGLFVHTPNVPQPGEKVWLRLEGLAGEPVAMTGVVWWTTFDAAGLSPERPGFGVRLVETGPHYLALLESLDPCS